MNSKLKATTLTLAVLSLGVCFQQFAFAYDPNEFPGKGNEVDFKRSTQICNEGTKLLRQGKFKDSIFYYKKAISGYPYAAGFHYNLGRAYGELNDLKSALQSYANAIKLAPDLAPAYSNISDVQFKLKDYSAAEQSALTATKLNSKSPAAFINLAQAEIALKKIRSARQHIEMAQQLPDSGDYASDLTSLSQQIQRSISKTAEN